MNVVNSMYKFMFNDNVEKIVIVVMGVVLVLSFIGLIICAIGIFREGSRNDYEQ